VATGDPGGIRRFRAADYEDLIDHPVEMADFVSCAFTAGGARHDVANNGRHEADLGRLASNSGESANGKRTCSAAATTLRRRSHVTCS
jgi:predicted metalloprotease with PDZ domain